MAQLAATRAQQRPVNLFACQSIIVFSCQLVAVSPNRKAVEIHSLCNRQPKNAEKMLTFRQTFQHCSCIFTKALSVLSFLKMPQILDLCQENKEIIKIIAIFLVFISICYYICDTEYIVYVTPMK